MAHLWLCCLTETQRPMLSLKLLKGNYSAMERAQYHVMYRIGSLLLFWISGFTSKLCNMWWIVWWILRLMTEAKPGDFLHTYWLIDFYNWVMCLEMPSLHRLSRHQYIQIQPPQQANKLYFLSSFPGVRYKCCYFQKRQHFTVIPSSFHQYSKIFQNLTQILHQI